MEKTIYVITEYGVCDEHYYNTHVFGNEEEALDFWDKIKVSMKNEADAHDLTFVEYKGHNEMEYYDEEDTLGNFHKACMDVETINV